MEPASDRPSPHEGLALRSLGGAPPSRTRPPSRRGGPDPNGAGGAALQASLHHGHIEIAELLIAHAADISSCEGPLHGMLRVSALYGVGRLAEFIRKHRVNLQTTDHQGRNILHLSALLATPTQYSILLIERAVVGLLRICLILAQKVSIGVSVKDLNP